MRRSTRKNNYYADPPPPAKRQTRASSKKDRHDVVALDSSVEPAVAAAVVAAVGERGKAHDQTKNDKMPADDDNNPNDVNKSVLSPAAGQVNNEDDDDEDDNASKPIACIVNEAPPPRKCICSEHSGDTHGCPLHPFNPNWELADNVVVNRPTIMSVLIAHNAKSDENNDDDDDNDDEDDGTIPVATVLESHNDDDDESFPVDEDVQVLGKSSNSDDEYKHNDEENDDDNGVNDESEDDMESEESVEVVGQSSDEDDDEYDAKDQEGKTAAVLKSSNDFMSDFSNFLADDSNFDAFDAPAEAEDDNTNLVSARLIGGGPTKPDTTGMTDSRAAAVLRQYRSERKKYTDKLRSDRLRKAATAFDAAIVYTGDQSPLLRMLDVVKNNPTHVGHSFPTRKLVQLRIVEEALQLSKHVIFKTSDSKVTEAIGINLHCRAVLSEAKGWVINKLCLNTRGHGLSTLTLKNKNNQRPCELNGLLISSRLSLQKNLTLRMTL